MRHRDTANPPTGDSAAGFERTPPPHPTTDQTSNPTVEVSDPTPTRQERGWTIDDRRAGRYPACCRAGQEARMRHRDTANPPTGDSAAGFERTPPPHPTTDQTSNPTVEVSDPTPTRQERGNRGPEEEPGFGQGA